MGGVSERGELSRPRSDGTKRLTASERESLLRLNVALEILHSEMEPLKQRASMIPYARRDMAMMASRIMKMLRAFADTIPLEQMMTYRRALEMVSYTIGVKRPGMEGTRDEKNYGMWIPYEVLNALLAGCHDHCLMCPADKAQRRACKLRKALEIIPKDTEDRPDDDCPFYTLL